MVSATGVDSIQKKDYINFQQDRALMQLIGDDTFLYANMVKKTNMFEWTQERTLVITNQALYNIHKKKIKRVIMIAEIGGITKTVKPSKNEVEFTVHVPSSYDYRFISDVREEIIKIIKSAFFAFHKKNLPIFHVTSKDLRDYTTTEKDMKKSISRFPLMNMRAKSEDIFNEDDDLKSQSDVKIDDSGVLASDQSGANDLKAQQDARGQQLKVDLNADDSSSTQDTEFSYDDADQQVRQSMAGGAEAVFARGGDNEEKPQLQDFEIRKMVGKGTFGKVFMVENVKNGKLYAMKCIRKDIILENEQMENIQLEKDILYTINHPFLVNMEYVFQNDYRIYFLMKFVRGGELFRHLVEVRMFPENQAKFFAAQVAMALAHLHTKKIIYRDLKPENVLVNEDGYLLVADFGLAKFVKQGELANSFCGTAEYLAPEMLIGNGHDFTVDWWALGILIFEMIVGIPPFFNRNKHRMYFLIRESPVNFPDPKRHKIEVSPEAQDLIVKLLDKDRTNRLGANGVEEILSHPWFADLDMDKLLKKELVPPYVPKSKEDLSYFDKKLTSETEVADTILTAAQRSIVNKDQNQFKNFSI